MSMSPEGKKNIGYDGIILWISSIIAKNLMLY